MPRCSPDRQRSSDAGLSAFAEGNTVPRQRIIAHWWQRFWYQANTEAAVTPRVGQLWAARVWHLPIGVSGLPAPRVAAPVDLLARTDGAVAVTSGAIQVWSRAAGAIRWHSQLRPAVVISAKAGSSLATIRKAGPPT